MKKHFLLVFLLLTVLAPIAYAQGVSVTGNVTDENGESLPGATVLEKGTSNGAITDIDGNYSLTVSSTSAVLQISFVGFTTREVSLNGQTVVDVGLQGSVELDEVVISALGISREKSSLGYSVTEVDGDDVSTVKESNVASNLAGRVAGVVVTRNTSGAGGATRVIIRGNNSLAGNNEPLYVVDGVPIDNQNSASSVFESGENTFEFNHRDYGNGISDINADDIESISILKGPNAAALYGSRASNGVVLITTKKGTAGQGIGVSISSSATFENPMLLPDFQNEFGRGTDGNHPTINASDNLATQVSTVKGHNSWGPRFDGSNQLEFNGQMAAYSAQPDNVKDFFETGKSFVNSLALTGGTDKASFRFSYTRSDISSILPNAKVERNNFSLRGTSKLSDKLSVDAKVNYFSQEANNRPIQGSEGVMGALLTMPRNINTETLRTYQDTDNPIDTNNPFSVIAPVSANPFWMQEENANGDRRKRITGFAKLDYQFNDWLSAFARVGTDDLSQDLNDLTAFGNHFFSNGLIQFRTVDRTETNYDFLFMANKRLGDRFDLSANFGGNARHTQFIESRINGENFKIPGRYFLNNTEIITAQQSDLIEKKVNSLYGSASLSMNDMIYLDITGRNDWSSALPAENRSYFYTSASLAVLLDQALNLNSSTVDLLKLRLSTANVGNDTDPLQVANTFQVAANGYLGNISINREQIRFSESLRPEDIGTVEIGAEFALFGKKLYGDLAYYQITTKDLIFDVPVDPGTGFSFFRENIGELTNTGFEMSLGGTPVSSGDFTWNVNANFAKNTNELVSLIEGQDVFTFSNTNSGIVDVRAEVGGGFGDIYATDWLRNDAGDLILTAEGRPQATSERVKVGNYQPDLTGGITNTFKYKNLTFNALIDFRIGGQVYAATDAALDRTGVSKNSLEFRENGVMLDGVIEQGDGSFLPNTNTISAEEYWGAVSGIGSEYIFDQTNVRLRELSVAYRLPSSIMSSTGFKSATVRLIGRNLFFLHKEVDNFDPESSYSTGNFSQGVLWFAVPSTKSIGFSLNVNF